MSTKTYLILATLGVVGSIVCCILWLPQVINDLCLWCYFINAAILIIDSWDW